jgi:leader peptidase (prepilin peptidase) / N-methyltransferase
MTDTILLCFVLLLGLSVGSFLNVLIYRIPRGEAITLPRSHCTQCNTSLRWYHNIPVLSWLLLRGKCAFCDAPISGRYPMVELITAILFVMLYHKLGVVWYLPFVWASFAAPLALVMIDFEYFAVPDLINFSALALALVQPEWPNAIKNAAIAAALLFLLAKGVSLLAKKETMGSADVIVAGTMAALLGFPLFFAALFLSALLALLPSLMAKDTMVPFVPFLATGTLIVYLFDAQAQSLLDWITYG